MLLAAWATGAFKRLIVTPSAPRTVLPVMIGSPPLPTNWPVPRLTNSDLIGSVSAPSAMGPLSQPALDGGRHRRSLVSPAIGPFESGRAPCSRRSGAEQAEKTLTATTANTRFLQRIRKTPPPSMKAL